MQVCAIAELFAAAAGPRGSVGTIAAGGHARSTASRSGNTPGSPDQPNHDRLVAAIAGYSPVIHNFHRFIHSRIDVSHRVERAVLSRGNFDLGIMSEPAGHPINSRTYVSAKCRVELSFSPHLTRPLATIFPVAVNRL